MHIHRLLIIPIMLGFLLAYGEESEFDIVGHWSRDNSHVFTVATKVTELDKLQEFGETLPYVLGKNTTVYYFSSKELAPDVTDWPEQSWTMMLVAMKNNEHYKDCVALWDRLSSGDERIVPEPAKYLKDRLF